MVLSLGKEKAMAGKMGRPKEENPRDKSITVRLTQKEHEQLMEYSEKNDKTITQVVVEGLNNLYEKKTGN